MPITALSGVRISWLMAARNELLASFACSAAWRASWASSNRRAFSTATPMLAATVASSRGIGVGEPVLLGRALDADRPDGPVARQDRHAQERAGARPHDGGSRDLFVGIQEEGLPALDDLGGQALAEGQRLLRLVRSPLDVVGEVDDGPFLVQERDEGNVRVERLA